MTLTERVAAVLQSHAGRWVDGQDLAKVGGYAGWSARCRDLRKPPYNWTIENRQRTIRSSTGRRYKITEYRLVPHGEASESL